MPQVYSRSLRNSIFILRVAGDGQAIVSEINIGKSAEIYPVLKTGGPGNYTVIVINMTKKKSSRSGIISIGNVADNVAQAAKLADVEVVAIIAIGIQ